MNEFSDYTKKAKFLRILWCDNGNVIRSKALRLKEDQSKAYVGISRAQQAVPVTYDGVVPDSTLDAVGEVYLKADISTLHYLPYAPGNVMAIGDMYFNDSPWDHCPRNYLKKMISLATDHDLTVKAAFENEFYLLNNGSETGKCDEKTPFASTSSMNINNQIIMEIIDSLESQDVIVEQYYPESGPCQQEITIEYADALRSCDNQIIFRETVRGVALQNNLSASFLPKIFPDHAGSGCHIHLSLWKDNINILHDPKQKWGISKQANHFIAGILEHITSLMAITTPISNSYKRILPHAWAGKFKCWGLDNREASIRVIKEPDGCIKHFEIKTSDATANPYIALGAIIKAGIDGINKETQLPEPVQIDPANMSDKERIINKITNLPSDPGQAIEYLENDEILIDSLGIGLSKSFIAVKKEEWRILKVMDMEKEVDLLINKY